MNYDLPAPSYLTHRACDRLLLLDGQVLPRLQYPESIAHTRPLPLSQQNPYWGNPDDTIRKVEEFWRTYYLDRAPPVAGALTGLTALASAGFRLVLVTARQARELERSLVWLEQHLPGLFDWMICTGQSQETLADEKEMVTKLSKADVRTLCFLAHCFPPSSSHSA